MFYRKDRVLCEVEELVSLASQSVSQVTADKSCRWYLRHVRN